MHGCRDASSRRLGLVMRRWVGWGLVIMVLMMNMGLTAAIVVTATTQMVLGGVVEAKDHSERISVEPRIGDKTLTFVIFRKRESKVLTRF